MHPGVEHDVRALLAETVLPSQLFHLVEGEDVGQLLQHVPRTTSRALHALHLALDDGIPEESQLTPKVVLLTPADEILDFGFPLAAVSHVEHARLQVGDHVGTEGEVLVDAALRHSGEVGVLVLQFDGELVSLRTVDVACDSA